jgi:hypothetical protein
MMSFFPLVRPLLLLKAIFSSRLIKIQENERHMFTGTDRQGSDFNQRTDVKKSESIT